MDESLSRKWAQVIKTMFLISARLEVPIRETEQYVWMPQYILDCDGDAAIAHCNELNQLRHSLPPLVRGMIYTYIMLEVKQP